MVVAVIVLAGHQSNTRRCTRRPNFLLITLAAGSLNDGAFFRIDFAHTLVNRLRSAKQLAMLVTVIFSYGTMIERGVPDTGQ